jgi:hypothetical protein
MKGNNMNDSNPKTDDVPDTTERRPKKLTSNDYCSSKSNDGPMEDSPIEAITDKSSNNQETSIMRRVADLDDLIIALFDENKLKSMKEKIKGNSFEFEFQTEILLKKIDGLTVMKYLMQVGELLVNSIKSLSFCVVIHNNYIHIFTMEFGNYTDIKIKTYTNSIDGIHDEFEYIKNIFKDITRPEIERISLHWGAVLDGKIEFFRMEEDLDDIFYHESYPYIDIEKLCKEFISSLSPILILLGPPGTGKTRLIRYLLKHIASLEEKSKVRCVFTSDQKVIEDGYIFTKFLTGEYNALILEDIDFHLTPRTDGNTSMYHLLNISNGIASNYMKYKKIILSTNLPNINNIDEALLRPGRCFDIIKTRLLNKDESSILLKLIGKTSKLENRDYPISDLYNIDYKTRKITIEPKKGISQRTGF